MSSVRVDEEVCTDHQHSNGAQVINGPFRSIDTVPIEDGDHLRRLLSTGSGVYGTKGHAIDVETGASAGLVSLSRSLTRLTWVLVAVIVLLFGTAGATVYLLSRVANDASNVMAIAGRGMSANDVNLIMRAAVSSSRNVDKGSQVVLDSLTVAATAIGDASTAVHESVGVLESLNKVAEGLVKRPTISLTAGQ